MNDLLLAGGKILDIFDLKGVEKGKLQLKIQLLVGTNSIFQRSKTEISETEIANAVSTEVDKNEIRLSTHLH